MLVTVTSRQNAAATFFSSFTDYRNYNTGSSRHQDLLNNDLLTNQHAQFSLRCVLLTETERGGTGEGARSRVSDKDSEKEKTLFSGIFTAAEPDPHTAEGELTLQRSSS